MRNIFSYCTQDPFFFEGSLKENLTLTTIPDKFDQLKMDNTIKKLLRVFNLDYLIDRDPSLEKPLKLTLDFFSGGEKKRLGLIRSFLKNEIIEIYDEPTSYLDEKGAEIIVKLLSKRSKEKINKFKV